MKWHLPLMPSEIFPHPELVEGRRVNMQPPRSGGTRSQIR
jgi:hypothetical protein